MEHIVIVGVLCIMGILSMVGGASSIYDDKKPKEENERNRWGVLRVSLGSVMVLAGILIHGMNVRGEKVTALESRVSALEAQLAKQQPAAQNNATEQKK